MSYARSRTNQTVTDTPDPMKSKKSESTETAPKLWTLDANSTERAHQPSHEHPTSINQAPPIRNVMVQDVEPTRGKWQIDQRSVEFLGIPHRLQRCRPPAQASDQPSRTQRGVVKSAARELMQSLKPSQFTGPKRLPVFAGRSNLWILLAGGHAVIIWKYLGRAVSYVHCLIPYRSVSKSNHSLSEMEEFRLSRPRPNARITRRTTWCAMLHTE